MYLVLTTSLLYLAFSGWGNDDPYITYRYAHNLAAGKGFVYNPGEQVLSTTTPLFTLLLALATPVWEQLTNSAMPQLANLVGAFSLALGGLFLWLFAGQSAAPMSVEVGLRVHPKEGFLRWVGWTGLVLYPTFPLLVSTIGSEMPLYLAICLGALVFYKRRGYLLAALLAALAVLIRPDGFLLAGLLLLDYLFQPARRPIPWLAGLIFAGLVLPWFLFTWGYFGTPVPATLAAKQHQGLMAISQRFAPGLLTVLRTFCFEWFFWLEAILGLVGLVWSVQTRRFRPWLLLYIWTGLYFGAYTLLGVSRYFWYYAPLVPSFIVSVGLGIAACSFAVDSSLRSHFVTAAPNREKSPTDDSRTVIASSGNEQRVHTAGTKRQKYAWLAMISFIALLAIGQVVRLNQMRSLPDPRLDLYQSVGEWLKENTAADARIGTLEVGIIGYYSQRAMIDFAGLLQPEVAAQIGLETTYADSAEWAAARYSPDILVLQEELFPALEAGYVAQHCRFTKQFLGEPFGYAYNLNIYRCLG